MTDQELITELRQELRDLQESKDHYADRCGELEYKLEKTKREANQLSDEVRNKEYEIDELKSKNSRLERENDELERQVRDLEYRMRNLERDVRNSRDW